MDVTWSTPYLEGGVTFGTGGHASVSGPFVATVVDWLRSLPILDPSEDGTGSCAYASFYGSEPVFTFHTTAGTVAFAYQFCHQVAVTIDGKPLPTLKAVAPSLPDGEEFMRQALHVQPPPG